MRRATYELVNLVLYGRYGPRDYWQLTQKLLATHSGGAGFVHVVERGVQGVEHGRRRWRREIPPTDPDDHQRLESFSSEGCCRLVHALPTGIFPLWPMLRLARCSDWHIAKAEYWNLGRLRFDKLRESLRLDLRNSLHHFPRVVGKTTVRAR